MHACPPARRLLASCHRAIGTLHFRAACHLSTRPCTSGHQPTHRCRGRAFYRHGTRPRTCGHRSTSTLRARACYFLTTRPCRRAHQATCMFRNRKFCCSASCLGTLSRLPTCRHPARASSHRDIPPSICSRRPKSPDPAHPACRPSIRRDNGRHLRASTSHNR